MRGPRPAHRDAAAGAGCGAAARRGRAGAGVRAILRAGDRGGGRRSRRGQAAGGVLRALGRVRGECAGSGGRARTRARPACWSWSMPSAATSAPPPRRMPAWLAGRDGEPPVGDAITVNPYLGADSVAPFLAACGDGAGVLVLPAPPIRAPPTCSSSSWRTWAARVGTHGRADCRVGCLLDRRQRPFGRRRGDRSNPARRFVARARELMPAAPFLLPGVGAQGGTVDGLRAAFSQHPAGGLVSASRSVIYACRERGGDCTIGARGRRRTAGGIPLEEPCFA